MTDTHTITIIRHAEPGPGTVQGGDFARELTPRGRLDAAHMGTWLRDTPPLPELILCSPSVRTRTTAVLLLEAAGCGDGILETDDRLYCCSKSELYGILDEHSACGHIAVVGHNPGLLELAYSLSGGTCTRLGAGGMVRIVCDRRIGPGTVGRLTAVFNPAG